MIDYNKYKTQISLPEFLINEYNFTPVKGSSNKHPKLEHPDTGEVYIVKKNTQGQFTYFDIHNDSVRGFTILDFLLAEHEKQSRPITLVQAAQMLDEYIDSGKSINPANSNFILNSEAVSESHLYTIAHSLKPLSHLTEDFLSSRGISAELLQHPFFLNTVWEKPYLDENKKLHHNVVFKMQNFSGQIAFSQRNQQFKGCLGPRGSCLTSSNVPRINEAVQKVYFGESMIDCISHFALNFDDLKDLNIAYLSSEGNLTGDQVKQFEKLLSQRQIPTFSLIFDNDLAGHYYSAMTLGNLSLPADFSDVSPSTAIPLKFSLSEIPFEINKNKDQSSFKFAVPFSFDIHEFTMYYSSVMHRANNVLHSVDPVTDPFSFLVNPSFKQLEYQVTFPSTSLHWKEAFNVIHQLKFSGTADIKRELPLLNDFNDDLTLFTGKNTKYSLSCLDGEFQVMKPNKSVFFTFNNPYPVSPQTGSFSKGTGLAEKKNSRDFSVNF